MLTFSYQIVPSGGGKPLTRGTLYIADVESAKRHVQTVAAPGVTAAPGMGGDPARLYGYGNLARPVFGTEQCLKARAERSAPLT